MPSGNITLLLLDATQDNTLKGHLTFVIKTTSRHIQLRLLNAAARWNIQLSLSVLTSHAIRPLSHV